MVSLADLLHTWQNKSQQQETKIYSATFHMHKLRIVDAGLLAFCVMIKMQNQTDGLLLEAQYFFLF